MRPSKPYSKRKKTMSQPTVGLSDVLPQVSALLNLEQKVQEFGVLSLWQRVVDPRFVAMTQAVGLKKIGSDRVMQVHCSHPTVASELSFNLPLYVAEINRYAHETGLKIDRINLSVK